MVIKTTKAFDKQYAKLNFKVKLSFKRRISLFKANPFEVTLSNHALKGKYLGYRSIDITGDVRALYITQGDTIIIFGVIFFDSKTLKAVYWFVAGTILGACCYYSSNLYFSFAVFFVLGAVLQN